MSLNRYQIDFEPVDSWFFRESRPHDATGAARLSSLFPPPARTLAGSVKTLLGNSLGVNWQQFAKGIETRSVDGQDLQYWLNGGIEFGDVRLVREQNNRREMLYPVPLCLLAYGDNQQKIVRLQPGEPVHCDLGRVRLPELAHKVEGAATLEKTWVTADDLGRILAGNGLDGIELIPQSKLVTYEPRLGIGRNNQTGTAKEGQLYQTHHIRLATDIRLSLEAGLPEQLASHLSSTLAASAIQRTGGEGRMAHLTLRQGSQPLPMAPVANAKTQGLILILANDTDLANDQGTPLPGFTPVQQDGVDRWLGNINGIELLLECCVVGKAIRRGGWDLKNSAPTPVRSLTPAGSCYFVRLAGELLSLEQAIKQLHGATLRPADTNTHQQGQIFCGLWN